MRFQEFQASRKWCDDLSQYIDSRGENEPKPKGYLYVDSYYIESITDHWPEEIRALGGWYLLIDRSEYVHNNLVWLEYILWEDFAKWEINHPGHPHRNDGRGFCIDCGDVIPDEDAFNEDLAY